MIKIFQKLKIKVRYIIINYIYKNSIKMFWFGDGYNFGDAVNPLFVNALTGKKVFWINPRDYQKKNYFVIGSKLHCVNRYSIVWGSGFISEESQCPEVPLKVHAVRGPKTRQKLLDSGIHCPEVYGDPALLLPTVYSPKIEKKYKLGIIPHFVDKDSSWLNGLQNEKDIKILDIENPNPFKFIDDVLSCEKIASSSLHGIIVADAYEIPSIWIRLSDKVIGGDFKFLDYFMSVHRKDKEPLTIDQNTTLDDLFNKYYDYNIDIDLELLIKSCPFELNKSMNWETHK